MASIGPITVMTRIGTPGAPPSLMAGQLAYNQPDVENPKSPGDALYIGDGANITEIVGAGRQVELWGDQTITGIKTIDIADLKITGGGAQYLLETDGQGNLTWTNAPGGGLTQVATDGVTLSGDGTTPNPLAVLPETVAVAIDGATMTGDGTTLHPLAVNADSVAVKTDGTTITGNGTTADPLAVVAQSVAVAANAPLSGNGTMASPLALSLVLNNTLSGTGVTGSPLGVVGATVPVATDGVTVTGNGTSAFPLQATSGTLAVAVDGTTIGGEGITANPLHVLPNSVPVATNATLTGNGTSASPLGVVANSVAVATNSSLTGNGTTASPLGLVVPVSLQNGGTGVSTSSNAGLLTALGAASSASLANYLPLTGGTLTGALTLAGNASANLQAVPLQQLNSAVSAAPFLPLSGGTLTGALSGTTVSLTGTGTVLTLTAGNASIGGTLGVTGATTLSGNTTLAGSATLTLSGNAAASLQAVPLQQLNSALDSYLPLSGGTMTGAINSSQSGNFGPSTIGGVVLSGGSLTASGVVSTSQISFNNQVILTPNSGQYTVSGPGGGTLNLVTLQTNQVNLAALTLNSQGVVYSAFGGNAFAFTWGSPNIGVYINAAYAGFIAVNTSDPRLKANIAPLAVDPLFVINQIALQQFDLTLPLPGSEPQHWSVGLMSDQLKRLIPEAVVEGPTFDGVSLLPLIAYLIGAVQQLTSRVEASER